MFTFCNFCVQSIKKEDKMASSKTATICGLPSWVGIPRNDTATFINNILLVAVNGSSAIFAFLGNLAVIVTIIKTPLFRNPVTFLYVASPSQIALRGLLLIPCLLCGVIFFEEPSSHFYIKFWCLTCITLSILLPLVYLSSALLSSVSIVISPCPDLWYILLRCLNQVK